MSYTALYRRYRPDNFSGLVGQTHIAKILAAAVSRGNFVHAYLFCGPRGTGKTSAARILARAINCQNPRPDGNPCDICPSCLRVKDGGSMDIIEIDGASNRGIDEIRDLRERVKYSPAQEKYKIYIIDEVHMLTNDAFNAILKTLEEPPAHVIFIFATTAPHKLPLTVLSRCQRFDFRRIGEPEIKDHLLNIAAAEQISVKDDAAALIAKKADGGMRDAVSLLDQCAGAADGPIDTDTVSALLGIVDRSFILKLRDHLLDGDISAILVDVNQLILSGKDLRQAVVDLCETLRDGLLAKLADEKASPYPVSVWLKRLSALADTDNKLRYAASPRITMELALIKACDIKETPPPPVNLDPARTAFPAAQAPTTATDGDQSKFKKTKSVYAQSQAGHSKALPPNSGDIVSQTRQPITTGATTEVNDLASLWPSILKRIEKLNTSTFFRVENCRPIQNCADELLLEFPLDRPGDVTYVMENKDQRATLDTAIFQVCGKKYRLQARLGDFNAPLEEADEVLPSVPVFDEPDGETEQKTLF